MRLKTIKLSGFKSFVDPTIVHFPSNMSAIVGPNGCGKSNIIDAVRWVMGESSAKHLRGDSMADVIFNGSASRKPVTQATIELIFDNSDASFGGEYAPFSEISIKRVVSRDSQSQYHLNGSRCRRKDITDIFLGTGLGSRSYAIIGQGMISRLIEAKPDELRVYIEEAAGISKYKERRRDTENRMCRTRENLERLQDLRDELARQLKRLNNQAKAAEKYKTYRTQLAALKAQLQAIKWQNLQEKMSATEKEVSLESLRLEEKLTERLTTESELEKQRALYTEKNEQFNQVQAEFYQHGAEISKIEQDIYHQKVRQKQIQVDLEETNQHLIEANSNIAEDEKSSKILQETIGKLSAKSDRLALNKSSSTELLKEVEEKITIWQNKWQKFVEETEIPRQQAQVEQNRIEHIENSLRRISEQIETLIEERSSVAVDPLIEEVKQLELENEQLEINEASLRENISELHQQIEGLIAKNANHQRALDGLNEKIRIQKGRLASLLALQQNALSEKSDEMCAWLARQGLHDQNRLAEVLEVEPGWELALEVVLGKTLQSICVEGDIASFSQNIQGLNQGTLKLLEAKNINAEKTTSDVPRLSEKVSCHYNLLPFLEAVYVAATLDEALAMRASLKAAESVITKDGMWFGPNWLVVQKGEDEEFGVIQREQEMHHIKKDIQLLEQKLAAVKTQFDDVNAKKADLEQDYQQQQQNHHQCRAHYTDKRAQLSGKKARLEQFQQRISRLGNNIEASKVMHQQESAKLVDCRKHLSEALDQMEKDELARKELEQERMLLKARLEESKPQAKADIEVFQSHEIQLNTTRIQYDSLMQAALRLKQQIAGLKQKQAQLQKAHQRANDPNDELAAALNDKLELKSKSEHKLKAVRIELEDTEQKLKSFEDERSHIERLIDEQRKVLDNSRMALQVYNVEAKSHEAILREEGYEIQQVLASLDEDAKVEQWQEDIEKMEKRITRLGAINLAAIDEYQQESERKSYLDQQHQDLSESLETLEGAIRKIDKETRLRFRTTFDEINNNLADLFPKVFGGGSASLAMTEEDLLNTGVTIMARPPGKRNSSINLLSGGEKALTAIALVFSIFQLNPAPFCILDEVDAPLDDANTNRYARLVEIMSEKIQFIYITHNKISMELANHLMGVTMHEPGCSRIVAVDVDEASKMAAA